MGKKRKQSLIPPYFNFNRSISYEPRGDLAVERQNAAVADNPELSASNFQPYAAFEFLDRTLH